MDSEVDVNRALLSDWLDWLERAAKWIAYGPPVQTPQGFRRERLAKVLEEGRRLSERTERIRA